MNGRIFLLSHSLIIVHVEAMQGAGLVPSTVARVVEGALIQFIPSERMRGEIIRIIRRTLKHEGTGTIEISGMEDAGHFVPVD